MFIQIVFLSLSLILTFIFFLYGFNHYYLLFSSRKYRSPEPGNLPSEYPHVSIHLPIYNEKYVVRRLITACILMAGKYGPDRAEIMIIDDSDDETSAEVDEIVSENKGNKTTITVLRRSSRQGFKAGALQYALEQTNSEYVAIFDADFIPPVDFLSITMPYFVQDEALGIVQSRWSHLNRDYNFLTRAVAIGMDVHFYIEQAGRYMAGCFQNFNGSGGVIKKKALIQAGGWSSDTLAEDLDVSYRIQLQGYRFQYLIDLHVPGEVPPTLPSFKKQQGRWACGSLRTAKKILPELLGKKTLGFKKRLEAFIHLTGYMIHPLMFLSFILACLTTILKIDSFRIADASSILSSWNVNETLRANLLALIQNLTWVVLGSMIVLCTAAVWITPVVTLLKQRLSISRNLISLGVLFLVGCGVSINNSVEAARALFTNRSYSFERTPKYGIKQKEGDWRNKKYQVQLDFVVLLELFFVALGVFSISTAVWNSNYGILMILVPYTTAYAFVVTLTISQSRKFETR